MLSIMQNISKRQMFNYTHTLQIQFGFSLILLNEMSHSLSIFHDKAMAKYRISLNNVRGH